MHSDDLYFADTPKHRGHDLALWFLSHAFKQEGQVETFRQLVRDTEYAHPGFMESPVIGLTLFRCIHMNRKDVILSLLAEGADVNMMFRGRCMLHETVKVSNEKMLSFLLSLPQVDKDRYDVDTKTPLMEASRGRPKCLRILLEANCDKLLTDSEGDTALHQTFREQRAHKDDILACMDILLEFGMDINAPGSQGKTCLQKAVEMGYHWLVKWLILHNCNLHPTVRNSRYIQGSFWSPKLTSEIPILIAFRKADRVLVEVLIACGCSFRRYHWILSYCKPYRLLHKHLLEAFRRVESLQTLCRKVIRNCLTTNIVAESKKLGLPESLQKFVLCQEELKALDRAEE
ncbi:uncharacterized protein LOC106077442 [Biomphalaria glabrata]|uniref:Uncharacterized protein LOC106077442 n=2 Tax=Biomphalaria TaxID=6525 RepID=A0A9W2Z8C2_BIOGL|nr:uncharacterized protein LOC106077442 [Biomphalaria glabrata]KAI8764500.1 ankyrin repeat and SOCS box protein 11 [Biomphalaria glabrata]KAK0066331.1 ankyrin repeat and SOCS box protein 11 [Biomphalaria pfeifferi]